jgi:hypothetical protein
MKQPIQLQDLIHELAEARRKYDRLAFDEEYAHELGQPCSPNQIATLERILGKPLPPSYRAFLELHNGWNDFVGDAKLLAVEDHGSEWVKKRLLDLSTLFADFGENPFNEGAIPVLLGNDARGFLIVDPRTVRQNGEMDFVSFHIVHEEDRFEDFTSFLQHKLNLLQERIDDQVKGVTDDDED